MGESLGWFSFRESLDCCHNGKDTAIKLSSKVTHRSGGKDQLLTCYNLVNKHSHSDSWMTFCLHSFTDLILTLLLNGPLTKLSVLLGAPVPSISRQHADTGSPTNCTLTHRLQWLFQMWSPPTFASL